MRSTNSWFSSNTTQYLHNILFNNYKYVIHKHIVFYNFNASLAPNSINQELQSIICSSEKPHPLTHFQCHQITRIRSQSCWLCCTFASSACNTYIVCDGCTSSFGQGAWRTICNAVGSESKVWVYTYIVICIVCLNSSAQTLSHIICQEMSIEKNVGKWA